MLNSKQLNDLVLNLFKNVLTCDIVEVKNSDIYFNINKEEIILHIFHRCSKEPFKDNKPYTLDTLSQSYFPIFMDFVNSDSELFDFYLDIRNKQYQVPRPSLKEYAEWVETLNYKLQQYEMKLLTTLTNY